MVASNKEKFTNEYCEDIIRRADNCLPLHFFPNDVSDAMKIILELRKENEELRKLLDNEVEQRR